MLINDASNDNTLEVMEVFKSQASIPVTIVDVAPNEQFWGSKKYALTLGIKAAQYEHLLLTDADCIPNSENWIQEMTKGYSQKKAIVLGYGGYKKINNSFLNKLIRFETVITALHYFSFAKFGIPYMGVGRNLSYKKSLFYSVNGFIDHMKVKSGDDDLFINQVATGTNTDYCTSQFGFTLSTPKEYFKDWIVQKRRHISTANHYKFKHQFLLGLHFVSQLLFWVLAAIVLSINIQVLNVAILMGVKLLISYLVIGFAMKKFKESDLVIFIPFYSLFLIFMHLFIFIKNLISKPTNW